MKKYRNNMNQTDCSYIKRTEEGESIKIKNTGITTRIPVEVG
jgi:hypothetical protein